MGGLARVLVLTGVLLVALGVLLAVFGRIPGAASAFSWIGWIGRLPGDFAYRRDGLTIYVPLATCLLVSLVLTLLLQVFRR